MRALGLAAPALPALLTALAAAPAARAQPCDFSALDAFVADLVAGDPAIPGAAVRLGRAGGPPLHEAFFGSYGPGTVIPIASATKVVSAATVLTLVDDGLLDLDGPVSAVLPEFTGLKGTMTLRQMFSHTSGLPGEATWGVLFNNGITLAQAVGEIACCIDMDAPPATQFWYGGLSMHVGGRMAEVADGRSWDDLFAARIAGPLGMTSTDYEGLGVTDNPRIAGGIRTSLGDYAAFLEMLLGGGVYGGAEILGQASADAIVADQSLGLPIVNTPAGRDGLGYGLGVFRDVVAPDGGAVSVSDPGAFGFTPWLDLDLDAYGIFMVQSFPASDLIDEIAQIQDLARAAVLACTPGAVVACSNGADDDGDGRIDLFDPGCEGAAHDGSEWAQGLACDNGVDDDGDGFVDHPADPGCLALTAFEDPECQDGLDNDGDGKVDFDGGASILGAGDPGVTSPDPQCQGEASRNREAKPPGGGNGCGLGFELVLLGAAPGMRRLRRRRYGVSSPSGSGS